MREIHKKLIYPEYILDVWVNCEGTVNYTINDGKIEKLDIEVSESIHDYYVNPCNERLKKIEKGTKNKCIKCVIEYIREKNKMFLCKNSNYEKKEIYKVQINGEWVRVKIIRKESKKELNKDGTLNSSAWAEIIDEIMYTKLNVKVWRYLGEENENLKADIIIKV